MPMRWFTRTIMPRIDRRDAPEVDPMHDDGQVSPEISRPDQTSGSPMGQMPREPLEPTPPAEVGEDVSHWMLALAGMIAGAAGIALSQAAATALRAESGPVEAVAAAVRDLTPGPVALFLIHLVDRSTSRCCSVAPRSSCSPSA